jgi:hypothetical protein
MDHDESGSSRGLERLAWAQGCFFAVTGAWPILHRRSFEAVTGPKLEGWLLKTVGALLVATGATLIQAARRRRVTPEVALLGAGTAAVLGAVDFRYGSTGRIAPVYLADGVVESAIVAGWLTLGRRASAARAASTRPASARRAGPASERSSRSGSSPTP